MTMKRTISCSFSVFDLASARGCSVLFTVMTSGQVMILSSVISVSNEPITVSVFKLRFASVWVNLFSAHFLVLLIGR